MTIGRDEQLVEAVSEASVPALDLRDAYVTMRRIRRFEETCLRLHGEGKIQGSIHLCCGQEAIPVAAVTGAGAGCRVLATYRGHGWAIALGVPFSELLAEICGKASGTNGGRGGSPYLTAPAYGFLGENSIVGAGAPIAVGVALAGRLRSADEVTLVSIGDGATSQGSVHEAFVTAATLRVPVVFVCENNGWSEMTPTSFITGDAPLAPRVASYGIESVTVDGNDPEAVYAAISAAAARARRNGAPTFVECETHRLIGHYNADVEHYRPKDEKAAAAAADPLPRLRRALLDRGLETEDSLLEFELEIEAEIVRAEADAEEAALPDPASATAHVFAPQRPPAPTAPGESSSMTYVQAVNAALRRELAERPEALVFGEDIAVPGGVFGATRGLLKEFGPERVFDMPIAESGILGLALGLALDGFRPIAEIMWADFLLVALDQLVNQAANVRYLNEGRLSAPLVVRCQQGIAAGSCAQHTQSLEALLAHIPGLRLGLPATPHDAYAMLRAAAADPDPCVVVEARSLYRTEGPVELEHETEPVGGAVLRRDGSGVGIVTWGTTLAPALAAADALADDGVDASVLDLRWLSPLDEGALSDLVRRTGRLLVVHEANTTGGFGAEIVARVVEKHFFELEAPPARLCMPDVRVPAAPTLQRALLPNPDSIAAAARSLLAV